MSEIAKTNGAITGEPLEIREGILSDIIPADRSNWRTVIANRPGLAENETYGEDGYLILPDGSVVQRTRVVALASYVIKSRLKKYAEKLHFEKIQQGVVYNNRKLRTTEADQSKIYSSVIILEKGWLPVIRWKTADGWINVNFATMQLVAAGVAQYIQACDNAEEAINIEIDNGTITTKAQIESYGWPTNVI